MRFVQSSEVIVLAVAAAFVILTVATVIWTVFYLFGKTKIVTSFHRRLFSTLILAICSGGVVFAYRALSSESTAKELNKSLTSAKAQIEELRLVGEEWVEDSRERLNEPSGVTSTSLVNSLGRPIVLAVDDEENGVFALQPLDDAWVVVPKRGFLPFDKAYNDLEAIAHDVDENWYYALTSHRRYGIERESALVRFRLNQGDWNEIEGGATNPLIETQSTSLSVPIQDALIRAGGAPGLDMSEWAKKYEDSPHPYKLEIEGLTYYEGDLLLGLKWPLDENGRALLLTCDVGDFAHPSVSVLQRLELKYGYETLGISGLFYHQASKRLLAAANPPERAYTKRDREEFHGRSKVFVFQRDASGGFVPEKEFKAQLADTKLEGLAAVGEELWLAYDDGGAFRREQLRDFGISISPR